MTDPLALLALGAIVRPGRTPWDTLAGMELGHDFIAPGAGGVGYGVYSVEAFRAATGVTGPRPHGYLREVDTVITPQEMGKAAPRALRVPLGAGLREGSGPGGVSIDAEDEAQHPGWPAIDHDAPPAQDCDTVRAQYGRTRCLDPRCGRCWGGPT